MDMLTSVTPPGITFLRRIGSKGSSNYISTSFNRPQEWQDDSSLIKPLVSDTSSIKEEEPTSITPVKSIVSSYSKFSVSELPPPQQQCSFAQSVINGDHLSHSKNFHLQRITNY